VAVRMMIIHAKSGDTQTVITMLIDRKTSRKFAIIRRNCSNRRLNASASIFSI